jgi:uncharacterized protein YndB with AHSA1/START domain
MVHTSEQTDNDRVKIEMEFEVKSSPSILFNYISGASGLSEWFADRVNVQGLKKMVFMWGTESREAEILKVIPKKSIKFKWLDDEYKHEYWELEIVQDELTNDVILKVTDFGFADEMEDMEQLWGSQVDELKSSIGA